MQEIGSDYDIMSSHCHRKWKVLHNMFLVHKEKSQQLLIALPVFTPGHVQMKINMFLTISCAGNNKH